MWKEIDGANNNKTRAIIFGLTSSVRDNYLLAPPKSERSPELVELLDRYLNHSDSMIVAEAIDGLNHLGVVDFKDRVMALRNHSSPFVRGSVLRYAANLLPEQAFSLLIQALRDSDFIVRENAVDELGELGRVEAIPYLEVLVNDANPNVRQAVETAIHHLQES